MKNKGSFIFINFAEAPRPVFKERRGAQDQIVTFGEENDYPEYLLGLYNNSSKHGAIIGGKADYIAGKGVEGESPLVKKANRYGETLHKVLKKCALDVEIFGGYYLEVVANNEGTVAELVHVPFHKVRLNKKCTKAYLKDQWSLGMDKNAKPRELDVYGSEATEGPDVAPRSLYVYKEYRPGVEVYAVPGYMAALNWIAADVEISRHVLQNAQAGFMPSKLINLNDGEPTEDEKKEIEKAFNNKFTGHEGKKLIISFNNSQESAPTIQDLGVSDITKEDFSRVDQLVEQNVFSGHRITSPMLFGIKTQGQLGGRTEMRDAWELLKNNYIELKQQAIEESLEKLVGEFDIIELEPIGFESSDAVLSAAIQVAPKRWLLDKLGISIEEYPEAFPPPPAPAPPGLPGMGAPGLPGMPPAPPGGSPQFPPGTQFMAGQVDYSIFGKFGAPKGEYQVIKNRQVKFSSDLEAAEDELALVQTQEFAHLKFAVTTLEGRILELLKEDSLMSIRDLASSLEVKPDLVQNTMDKMIKAGSIKPRMVKDQDGTPVVSYDITDLPLDQTRPSNVEIGVRYSYEVKPEYREPNDDDRTGQLLPTSRDFCRELIQADRFYTRKDIEAMSAEMGYSVWDQKGGWMTERGTDVRIPECRHTWVSNVVVKKQR